MESGPSDMHEGYAAVLLVGFMAAGKTAVGRALARRTGWRLVDVDSEIVARTGADVSELFRTRGEIWFREEEERLTREALDLTGVVVVPGGGWAAAAGRMEGLSPRVLSVWLRVSPETAVERAANQGETRPLLAGPEPVLEKARRLLALREPSYRRAALHLDTEGRVPLELADEISEILRRGTRLPRP